MYLFQPPQKNEPWGGAALPNVTLTQNPTLKCLVLSPKDVNVASSSPGPDILRGGTLPSSLGSLAHLQLLCSAVHL